MLFASPCATTRDAIDRGHDTQALRLIDPIGEGRAVVAEIRTNAGHLRRITRRPVRLGNSRDPDKQASGCHQCLGHGANSLMSRTPALLLSMRWAGVDRAGCPGNPRPLGTRIKEG